MKDTKEQHEEQQKELLENYIPAPVEEQPPIAEQLTDAELDSKINKIVDEKVALANTSTDDEEDEVFEDEDEVGQSMGVFPFILIGGVALVAIGSLYFKNSPHTSPTSSEEISNG